MENLKRKDYAPLETTINEAAETTTTNCVKHSIIMNWTNS